MLNVVEWGVLDWAALAGGAGALSSALAAFGALKAARAAEKSVALSEKTAALELRAYAHVREAKLVWLSGPHAAVDIDLQNCGQTPIAWFEVALCPMTRERGTPRPSAEDFQPFTKWDVGIGPGAGRTVRTHINNELFPHLRRDFIGSNLQLIVEIKIRYKDMFGKIHTERLSAATDVNTGRDTKMSFTSVPA